MARRRATGQRERQLRIRELVGATGSVRTEDIAEQFGVSVMTVHRDLDALQAQGWLRKVRGGATAIQSAAFHGDLGQRMSAMAEVKKKLAHAALEMIGSRQTIMIDDSTTCLHLAQRLTERAPITVITNFLPVVQLLAEETHVTLVALGGTYFRSYKAFLGLNTAEAVAQYRADALFMSTTAITRGRCYHQSQETVGVKRAMMAAASRRILLVDHTKFTRDGVYSLAPVADFDHVLVDSGTPEIELRRIRESGVRLTVV
ncbi:DeoR/GlpR family DNA-binding transcription regulator [Amycolatopsis sp. NPDC058340]|uniref:DeoR/GlpR family DNA-binding transcription regulator n=1 Tax=Amycolatopsis sp. NPDC058340 TaxID=3346453 RepID=UPI003646D6A7